MKVMSLEIKLCAQNNSVKFCIVVNQLNQELKQHFVILKEKNFLPGIEKGKFDR